MNTETTQEKRWLLEEKYKGIKNKNFLLDIKKLEKGEPLAYLIGNMPFLNCQIDLKYKPLIPRAETEDWVNNFIQNELKNYKIKNKNEKIVILDIFSGSGCIGISLLKNIKNIHIDFSEINSNFIKQIKKNIKLNIKNNSNYNIFQSNIFQKMPEKKYHFILANPPYIPKNKYPKISPSVKNYEDYHSLFANDKGLHFIKKLILESPKFLKKEGKIFIEFDEDSKNEIKNFLKKLKIKNFQFKKDQFKKDRILIIQK